MRRSLRLERPGWASRAAPGLRLALGLGWVLGCGLGCGRPAVEAAESAAPGVTAAERFVVWESNRTGSFRIWHAALEARVPSQPRQLSPEEPGRDHCCPAVSPDGTRLVYVALPAQGRKYLPTETLGELRLVELESGRVTVLSATARQNGENRAAVWWSPTELVYLEGDGGTRRLDLAAGTNETIVPASEGGGWLVSPGGGFASQGGPTFSTRRQDGSIRLAPFVGGCQPAFTFDGKHGIWTAGAGGPLDAIDLETRVTRSIVRHGDPRLPAGRRYLYFPAISADRTLFAWAASDGTHDHFRADYDLFVAELDPETLELAGSPAAIAPHPAIDRYPDVFSNRDGARLSTAPPAAERGPQPRPASRTASETAPGAVPSGAPPLFVWNSASDDNARAPGESTETLSERGAVWFDRRGRLALAGGWAEATVESAARVDAGLRGANSLTLALVVEPASLARQAGGALVALERGPRSRAFAVRQRGAELELQLMTGESRKEGGARVAIATLPDRAPHHVAFRFSPGRLALFLDGAPAGRQLLPGDFFPWKGAESLRFGAELAEGARFRGWLSDLAIWDREISDADVAAHAARAFGRLRAAPAVSGTVVEARLVARSHVPTLDEISPYRSALVVEEFELVKVLAGEAPPGHFRVARWALLGREPAPGVTLDPGATTRLTLEPYAAQPQLEAVVLSDTLPAEPTTKLYVSVGVDIDPLAGDD